VEVQHAILSDNPPDISQTNRSLPSPLARVVGRCLEKKADERFQSAHDLTLALETLSAGAPAEGEGVTRERRSPYPGLACFTEADAPRARGRRRF